MQLIRIDLSQAQLLWEMQLEAFSEFPEKYKDYDIDPACEKIDRIRHRLTDGSFYYFITVNSEKVGAVRVIDHGDSSAKRISPIFILKQYRSKGFATQAIKLAEQLHGEHNWALETILQEKGSCRLYEKLGYKRTGRVDKINEYMDLVYYEKD